MNIFFKYIIFPVIMIAMTPEMVFKHQGRDFPLVTDRNGNPILWSGLPQTFFINKNVPEHIVKDIKDAALIINDKLGMNAIEISDERTAINKKNDSINVITALKKHEYEFQKRMLAFSWNSYGFSMGGMQITDSDVVINIDLTEGDYSFKESGYKSLMVHELFHSLGIKHSNETADIMYPQHRKEAQNFYISQNTISEFHKAYGIERVQSRGIASVFGQLKNEIMGAQR